MTAPAGSLRVGAIDCGTNSIRLLVADLGPGGDLTEVVRRMEVVRLGAGVDRTGEIAPEAMARTLAVTGEYAAQCRELGAGRVRFVATSASRDARNAAEFVAGVREAFGDLDVAPEVVTGDVEARLSFTGATSGLAAAGHAGPYLVVDLGGGSTEMVRGGSAVEAARSIDIGCVRITERHLRSDPPTSHEIGLARAEVSAGVAAAEALVDLGGVVTVVGLAGSITTVTAHALRLSRYDAHDIHLARVSPVRHRAACDELLRMTRAERAALPYLHPGRVDVIGAGALIWDVVLERVASCSPQAQIVTSEHDILDGIALSLS
jgi:exopolyphosphatase / guanosine-5'-triphosphate,3'-diphosphate pyrophosphatase